MVTPEFSVGERIRYYRRGRGLSQAALAQLVGRTEDWLSRVERGVIPVDRLSVLLEIGRHLRVRDLSDLTGKAIVSCSPDESPEHESVPGVRHALYAQPSALADLPGQPLTVAELAGRVADTWRIYERERLRYSVVGDTLPGLLAEAYQTLHAAEGQDQEAAIRELVSIYHLLQVWCRRVGEGALSQIAADRAMTLADQLGDPVLISASAWNFCSILTNLGYASESADLALSTIDRYPLHEEPPAEHVSVHGALHLAAVIASVRVGRAPAAWDILDAARRLAASTVDRNDWRTSFGPTNVAMHSVHLAAEEGDAAEALRLADSVEDNPSLPLERRTRYMIEVMHAHRLRQDDMGVLFMAQKIRGISPEEMRFHPLVRAAIGDLMKRQRPSYRDEVRDLASHVGVLA